MQSLASLDEKVWWEEMEMLEIFAYRTVAVVHFTDQNWISKTVYCIRCVMVCKIGFTNWNAKIALLRTSMVVTYYIKLFRTGDNRHNGILMSLLLLVAETKIKNKKIKIKTICLNIASYLLLKISPLLEVVFKCLFKVSPCRISLACKIREDKNQGISRSNHQSCSKKRCS